MSEFNEASRGQRKEETCHYSVHKVYFTIEGILDRKNLMNAIRRIDSIYQDFELINQ